MAAAFDVMIGDDSCRELPVRGIAMGARNAFEEAFNIADRERWLKLPFTGVDDLPEEGQAW